MNTSVPRSSSVWVERGAIALFVLVYLIIFSTVIPSGDGQVYGRHIDANELVLNPNHLLMDPAGLLFCRLLAALGLEVGTLDALKWISALASVATLLIFHAALVAAGVRSFAVRALALLGLFASRNFLTMAISEEFFMLEMPLLAWALWLLIRLEAKPQRYALWLGVALGLATAVSINNVLLGVALVGYLLFAAPTRKDGITRAIAASITATLVCLPLFVGAYVHSRADGSFLEWMLAYGGEQSATGKLYGIVLTAQGVVIAGARLVLNTFTNLVSIGNLGTVLKSAVFGAPLEVRPQPVQWTIAVVMLVAVIVALATLAWWSVRNFRQLALVRAAFVWIGAYYLFNFLWDDSSDQFWFQMLPFIWLLFALRASQPAKRSAFALIAVLAPGLLLLNTLVEVVPLAFRDVEGYGRAHQALVREGDLEVVPGWDGARWIALDQEATRVRQVNIMTAAMARAGDPGHIAGLVPQIERELRAGHRVIIARVYDRDDDPTPWDQLRKLGWSREKLQQDLAVFDNREVATIGGVVFRELTLRTNP